jgi:hypothetical protein
MPGYKTNAKNTNGASFLLFGLFLILKEKTGGGENIG